MSERIILQPGLRVRTPGQAHSLPARLPRTQRGQSLTELALFIPVLILFVLGAANFGLALRADTDLTQVTQQAAQYLVNHPADPAGHASTGPSCSAAYAQCTADEVAAYLGLHGFATASVGVSFALTPDGVQKDLISVNYSFHLALPVPGMVSAGPLRGSTLAMSATAATIATTAAPTGVQVTAVGTGSSAGNEITWNAPPNPAGALLKYRILSFGTPITADQSLAVTSAYTDTYLTSTVPVSSTYYYYQVSAVQPDGLESPLSPAVHS